MAWGKLLTLAGGVAIGAALGPIPRTRTRTQTVTIREPSQADLDRAYENGEQAGKRMGLVEASLITGVVAPKPSRLSFRDGHDNKLYEVLIAPRADLLLDDSIEGWMHNVKRVRLTHA